MGVDAALFDLGGVVCRFAPERRLAGLAAACGVSTAAVRQHLYDTGFIDQCDLGRYDAEELVEEVRERLGFGGSSDELRTLWCSAFTVDDDVLELVRRVSSECRVGLLTNNDALLLDALPSVLPEVVEVFDPVLFSCELGVTKPAATAFQQAVSVLDTATEHTLLVDDSRRNVAVATSLGLDAVLFTNAEQLRWKLTERSLLGARNL